MSNVLGGKPDLDRIPQFAAGQNTRDSSDVRQIEQIQATIEERKREFELALLDMEEDPVLKDHVRVISFEGGAHRAQGVFRPIIDELRVFINEQCADHDSYFDEAALQSRLGTAFQNSMNLVVQRWQLAAKEGADWNAVCQTLARHFGNIAALWRLKPEMDGQIRAWFDQYMRGQQRNDVQENRTVSKVPDHKQSVPQESDLEARDRLNARALQAYKDLSYYRLQGGKDQRVIDSIQGQIRALEEQLEELPVSPEAAPAFSKISPSYSRSETVVQTLGAGATVRGQAQQVMRPQQTVNPQPAAPVSPWAQHANSVKQQRAQAEVAPEQPEQKKGWFKSKLDKVKGWFR